MAFKPDPVRPAEIQELGSREIKIAWQDGHQSLYRYTDLRRKCRCAACVDEWTGEPRLLPEKISEEIHPLATRPVGNYESVSIGRMVTTREFTLLNTFVPSALAPPVPIKSQVNSHAVRTVASVTLARKSRSKVSIRSSLEW